MLEYILVYVQQKTWVLWEQMHDISASEDIGLETVLHNFLDFWLDLKGKSEHKRIHGIIDLLTKNSTYLRQLQARTLNSGTLIWWRQKCDGSNDESENCNNDEQSDKYTSPIPLIRIRRHQFL